MAGAFEQTLIIGNVGREPELRYTQSGVAVCDFSVAVSTRWKDSTTNEQREKTNWYRVTAWRGLGEVCSKYVKKGMSVMVSGTVAASAYMGQDGQPRASLDLTARDVQFLTRADDDGSSSSSSSSSSGGSYDDHTPSPQEMDDIPF
ncbi:MAG: single-stranded DNA-binding protein [Anaerolineae bacterium]|nr:single-stranded DNA-binding protein [Anaerolineae bacterium]MDQ7035219.1 single-stranded DNA-binding protein [Anaerolineae bacterium]